MAGPASRMAHPAPDAVGRIACIGCGVIGGGWAAYFLARGHAVTAYAPEAAEERALRRLVDGAWPALESMGLAADAAPGRLRFTTDLGRALAGAGFVQESAPEDLGLKRRLFAEIDAALAPHIVIASSTSGFAMTDIQADCGNPQRTVVGHPFNPPYLVPLVEVAGGAATDAAAVDWAEAFYGATGKTVLRLEREIPGFIANRLQEALWREALHMVAAGEATVGEIDAAIVAGPGLRWAAMGPCLTFHLAGGEGGMERTLEHFGPALADAWTRLKAPALTAELRRRMVEGCGRAAGGRAYDELVRRRDGALVRILKALDGPRRANSGGDHG